ncbi:MAG: hypothetical protein JWR69_980 [Pedosphaera sp.]|nr:hypothetical protein [Pedosphaera sp.]
MEAFSSQGDGTLTIIKETSPTNFEVEQTVQTKPPAKTSTLDTKKDRIILIATEPTPTVANAVVAATTAATAAASPTAATATAQTAPAGGERTGGGQRGGRGGPGMLDILVVGR